MSDAFVNDGGVTWEFENAGGTSGMTAPIDSDCELTIANSRSIVS
jgi:hypothetical protein